MTDALIEKTRERGVLWLTLNNADHRNPLSSTMLAEITSSLETAYDDDEIRCIVIAARGPVFSAGHDLTEMARRSARPARRGSVVLWMSLKRVPR